LRTALGHALEAERPSVIEVPIERGAETSPWALTLPEPPS
jgi:acetolactate synthase-1/2/3 large subunit